MKLLVVLIVSLCSVGSLYAQENDVVPSQENSNSVSEDVFTVVEQMPEYQGGMNKMAEFLSQNIEYPKHVDSLLLEGVVYVQFVIDKSGDVKNVTLIKGIGKEYDDEAIRVIKMMPRWIPGRNNGKNIPVKYTIPIRFKKN